MNAELEEAADGRPDLPVDPMWDDSSITKEKKKKRDNSAIH